MHTFLYYIKSFSVVLLLLAVSQLAAQAQATLTLSNRDPSGITFDGNVFQAGTQFGNASIYAAFGGTGTKSFQIDSPGENLTKTITADGFFDIVPTGSTLIDKTKVKNFSGTITGSVSITVNQLSIATTGTDAQTNVAPGSVISVSYVTGAGTFPIDLAINGYKVQLLDANGNLLRDLLNSTDQITGREQKGVSKGDTRVIKATLPSDLVAGTYRVRVVTQGLIQNVIGNASNSFTVKAATSAVSIIAGNVGNASYCAGTAVSFPFSASGVFGASNTFKVQVSDATGTIFQDLTGTNTASPVVATLPALLTSGAFKFRIVANDPATISSAGNVNISALPTMTIMGNSAIVAGTAATVQLAFTGTAPWSLTYIDNSPNYAPTFTRSASFSTTTATVTPTLYTSTAYDAGFIKSFKDAGCGLSTQITGTATIAIAVAPLTITTVVLPQSYCPGTPISVSFTANGKLPTDANYQVLLSDENGGFQKAQVISASAPTSPITATPNKDITLVAGTGYKIMVVPQKGTPDYTSSINSVPASITLTRPPLPTVADVSFCPGTSPGQLTAVGTNLQWYVTGDSIVLAGPPTPPNDRNSRYLVRQIVNGCASSLAVINVTQSAPPSAPAISNVMLCQGGSGQLTSPITGALWYTTATGGTGSTQPPVISSQTAGDQTFYVSQKINGCESARATVKVTVSPSPSSPSVVTPTPVCQYAFVNPLSATGTNLTWYAQTGKLSGTPTPDTNTSGTQSYSVTQTVAGCESARSTIDQVVRAAPINPTADLVRYCVGDKPNALTATGTNLKWYDGQKGGIALGAAPGFGTNVAGSFTFYVSQTDNFGCESLRQSISVSIVAAPAAPTVTPTQIVCQFAQISPLAASPNSGLLWQGSGITGTTETAPTPLTTQPGTFTYSVSQKAGSCISQASLITVSVQKLPDAPAVTPTVNFCAGQNSTPLSATGTGVLTWYTNADRTGSALGQIIPGTAQVGSQTYYVTQYILQSDGKKCESPNSTVVVKVQTRPTAQLFGDGSINLGESTAIRVLLTGTSPWRFILWDKVPIETTDSLYVKWEKPEVAQTYSYSITNLTGDCGNGEIKNSYTLIVNKPLGVEPSTELLLLVIYPNPTTDAINVNWNAPAGETANLQLINTKGQPIKSISRLSTGYNQSDHFQFDGQQAGQYYLQLTTPQSGTLIRKIIKQ